MLRLLRALTFVSKPHDDIRCLILRLINAGRPFSHLVLIHLPSISSSFVISFFQEGFVLPCIGLASEQKLESEG